MRHTLPILLAGVLVGCGSPDPAAVGRQAQESLQKKLEVEYPRSNLRVESVEVVATGKPKYAGNATVRLGPSAFMVPVEVTSDGRTTLVGVSKEAFESAAQGAYRRQVAELEGKYSDYILSPNLMAILPLSLLEEPGDFRDRLQTVTPVRAQGRWLFGEGCKAHSCTSEMSAWAVHRENGTAVAVVLKDPGEYGGMDRTFRIYGADIENLPEPLREWGSNLGMTYMNAVGDVPEYIRPDG